MGIAFSCNGCGARYDVNAELAGRRVKCKKCGTAMAVPAPAVAEPDDPYGLDEGLERDVPPAAKVLPRGATRQSAASAGVPVWVWLAGVAAVLVVLLLMAGMMFTRSGSVEVAVAPVASAPPAAAEPADTGGVKVIRDNATALPESAAKPAWRVTADPASETFEYATAANFAVPIPESFQTFNSILYPQTPSPFVIVGGNDADNQVREVWDLRKPERVGRLGGKIETAKPLALSADGAYFVTHTNPVPRSTDVWRVSDAQRIIRLQDGENIPDVIAFAGPGPGKLVIGTSYAKFLQVWDFLEGKPLAKIQTPDGFDKESIALSPGRRFLALTLAQKDRLQIYDLTTGRVVGEIALEKDGNLNLDCKGLAFSPDGTGLAGLFSAGFHTHLLSWNATTGAPETHVRTESANPYGKPYGDDPPVQWLPDQSGWLVCDRSIVERKTGRIVWTLPDDRALIGDQGPRKMLDAGRVVAQAQKNGRKFLQIVSLPADRVKAALAIVKEGGSAADAILPPVKTADRKSAQTVATVAGPVKWAVTPEPAPTAKPPLGRPLGLRAAPLDLISVLLSGASENQALVVSSPNARLEPNKEATQSQQPRTVERFDLAAGRSLGRFELPSVVTPVALGPGAKPLLLTRAGAPDRLDLFATADGAHVVGWRPYESETGDARQVAWADFLDPQRILTINPAGTLILWSVPDCKAVYVATQALQGVPSLSPGRTQLAGIYHGGLRILDPASGTPLGDGPTSGDPDVASLNAAGFSPDGKELAAVVAGNILVWELKTGQIALETPAPALVAKAASLRFGGERHVLIDDKVIVDLKTRQTVWYLSGGVAATGGPGGIFRYAAGQIGKPASLSSVELPPKSLLQAEAVAADPKTKSLIRPGATVSLQIVGAPSRTPDEFRGKLTSGLTERLKNAGVNVADGQSVRVVATFRERDLGQIIELRKLGGANNGETRTFAARNVEWDVSVVDAGAPIAVAADALGPRVFGIAQLPPGDNDWEGLIRLRQWLAAADQASAREFPYYVARRPNGPVVLPGWTDLGDPKL